MVNSPSDDFTPALFKDEAAGETILYSSTNRPAGPGGTDVCSSILQSSGTFGPAILDWALSTAPDDQRPNVRKDGREIFFDSILRLVRRLTRPVDVDEGEHGGSVVPSTNVMPLDGGATEG